MKLHALMIAVALASGAAYAQAPNGTAKAPADTGASSHAGGSMAGGSMASGSMAGGTGAAATASASTDMASPDKASGTVHKKKVAKTKKTHAQHHQHASAEHHQHHASAKHHEHHASAKHHEHHTSSAMGAGPASPSTQLDAGSRQQRMDSAYADWLRLQRR